MIIPSIDIMDGKAVQLQQGEKKILERKDPIRLAKELSRYGEIAIVDLDAAKGNGNNLETIKEICKVADCRVGGGIRTLEKAKNILKIANKIIIGTKAEKDFIQQLQKERTIIAIDSKNSLVVNEGWKNTTNYTPQQKINELEDYCDEFLFTNINKEGMMEGIEFPELKTKNKITLAGGITTKEDIKQLEDKGFNSQIGMALYTGNIDLAEAYTSLLDFTQLIPTIVVENQVLMLAYSSKESLKKTLRTGKATYYSRSRKILWVKGETSGNTQDILKVKYDCDKDALLFKVKQKGNACHTGSYSCFGEKEFSLNELYKVIKNRKDYPKNNSFTSSLFQSQKGAVNKICEKIGEESSEVILAAKDDNKLIEEIGDLFYFSLCLMAEKGIEPEEVENELKKRQK